MKRMAMTYRSVDGTVRYKGAVDAPDGLSDEDLRKEAVRILRLQIDQIENESFRSFPVDEALEKFSPELLEMVGL